MVCTSLKNDICAMLYRFMRYYAGSSKSPNPFVVCQDISESCIAPMSCAIVARSEGAGGLGGGGVQVGGGGGGDDDDTECANCLPTSTRRGWSLTILWGLLEYCFGIVWGGGGGGGGSVALNLILSCLFNTASLLDKSVMESSFSGLPY